MTTAMTCDARELVLAETYESSSCARKEPLTRLIDLEDYFDFNDKVDLKRLQAWCEGQWIVTFRRSLINSNAMNYHTCCNTFTRRHFMKSAGHPEHRTIKLNKIPSFKAIEDAEGLFKWLVSVARDNDKQGLKTPFPSVNKRHTEKQLFGPANIFKTSSADHFTDLQNELTVVKAQLHRLTAENLQLLHSSKTWYSKYQELLDQRDHNEFLLTPFKKLNNSKYFLENS